MFRNVINRNGDAGAAGGAAATPAEPVVKGFEALSEITGIENQVNTTSAEPVVETPEQIKAKEEAAIAAAGGSAPVVETPEQIKAREEAAAASGAAPVEVKLDAEGNQVNDKGEIIKTKQEIELETPITEFKIEGAAAPAVETPEDKARKEALADLAKESSWKALAKLQGVDIAEDSLDAYEAGIKLKNETEKAEILVTAKQQAKDELLAERPAEVMAVIEGLEQGFTLEEILEPTKKIEALEALSNAELIAEDCRLLGWSQDLIDKHIADLTEKDKLDLTAQPLRDLLKANKTGIAEKQLEHYESLKQSKVAKESEARIRESDEIKNTIVSMKTYMGVPIDEKVVNHIQQKWNKGEYHEAFKDSKVVAEFLMYKEFGPQGLKALENRAYQRGRDEKAMKLHNVPPVVNAGGKAAPAQTVKAEGNFGALPTGG